MNFQMYFVELNLLFIVHRGMIQIIRCSIEYFRKRGVEDRIEIFKDKIDPWFLGELRVKKLAKPLKTPKNREREREVRQNQVSKQRVVLHSSQRVISLIFRRKYQPSKAMLSGIFVFLKKKFENLTIVLFNN